MDWTQGLKPKFSFLAVDIIRNGKYSDNAN